MQAEDWQALSAVLPSLAGIIISIVLAYIVRQNRSMPKPGRILIWAVIWAIGGAIMGLADNEIETGNAALLGAFWGALLGLIGLSGWSLWKKS